MLAEEIYMDVPETFIDLMDDKKCAFAYLVTLMKDGTPQVTPVWFNRDEKSILINSAKGRVKDRNIRRNPLVAVLIPDPTNPYRYMQIRGKVIEINERGADDHIDCLSLKYTGIHWTKRPEEARIIYRISIEHVETHGE
jgi:PPOX class probable F420-dependent enzyme